MRTHRKRCLQKAEHAMELATRHARQFNIRRWKKWDRVATKWMLKFAFRQAL